MNKNIYAGALQNPSDNFGAVRDRRRAVPFYYDVDLSVARSISASTALVLNFAGNAFYCDANPADGSALVHFQDTALDRSTLPLFISPGAIFKIPFTQVLIENSAQVGKKIRIVYGVDVDFQPGSVAQQSISGSISTIEAVYGKAALSQAFSCAPSAAAIAGSGSASALWNPANSGKYLYVDEIDIIHGANLTSIVAYGISALGNLSLNTGNFNKFVGGPVGVAQGYVTPGVASTATQVGPFSVFSVAASANYILKYASPVIVPPGFGLMMIGSAVNDNLQAIFQYTEN